MTGYLLLIAEAFLGHCDALGVNHPVSVAGSLAGGVGVLLLIRRLRGMR